MNTPKPEYKDVELKGVSLHGTVEKKIRSIAEQIEGLNYMYVSWAQANYGLDKVEGPTMIFVLPVNGELYYKWDEVRDYPDALILFACPADFDFDGEENDELIEMMKRYCCKFLKLYNDSELFEPLEGETIPYANFYDMFDDNTTGVYIEPKIKELSGVFMCDKIRRKDDTEETVEDKEDDGD